MTYVDMEVESTVKHILHTTTASRSHGVEVHVRPGNQLVLDKCIRFPSAMFWCYLFFFPLSVPIALSGLELCDPPHRLMVAMVSSFFTVFAELLLPGIAVLCRDWPVLQAVATLPLLLLLSYWWWVRETVMFGVRRWAHHECIYCFSVMLTVPVSHCDIISLMGSLELILVQAQTPNSHTWVHRNEFK